MPAAAHIASRPLRISLTARSFWVAIHFDIRLVILEEKEIEVQKNLKIISV
jgi:hypothetical protein